MRTLLHHFKQPIIARSVAVLLLVVGWTAAYLSTRTNVHAEPEAQSKLVAVGSIKGATISQQSVLTFAKKVVATCTGAEYGPTCYEKEIPALMNTISMEDAFRVTRVVQDLDPSYRYCHVLGHKLSGLETAKDPSKWKEVVTRVPSGLCSNGGIHGAFQERFRAESFVGDELQKYMGEFATICEAHDRWNPTGMERATCYHALGHLLMYVTEASTTAATAACNQVFDINHTTPNMSHLCYDGAFMQVFQPLEPDDFSLIKGKVPEKADLPTYCGKFSGAARVSCWNESWPMSRDEIMDPKTVVDFCSRFLTENQDQARCIGSMFYIVTAQVQFETAKMADYCADVQDPWRGTCYANVSSRLIETDYRNAASAVAFCVNAKRSQDTDRCFGELLSYAAYNYHPGSAEFTSYCSAMPEPWQGRCFARGGGVQ